MSDFGEVAIRNAADTATVGITDPDGDGVGGADVYIQDQHTDILDFFLMNIQGTFTPLSDTVINTRVFTASPGHGISIGDTINFYEGVKFSQFLVLDVVGDVITIDSPFDLAYTPASTNSRGIVNMNVNGSVTPVVFSIGPIPPTAPATKNQWDVTRFMFVIQDGSSMDSSMFGTISGGLTNGIVIRQKNGFYKNYFNVKTNGDWGLRAYDMSFDDRAGGGGSYFFRARRTFAGPSKTGVTIRIKGEDSDFFEIVIQDDLTSLEDVVSVTQGHVVE